MKRCPRWPLPLVVMGFCATAVSGSTPPWQGFVTVLDPALSVTVTPAALPNQFCNMDTFYPPQTTSPDLSLPPEYNRGMKLTCLGGRDTWLEQGGIGAVRSATPEFPHPIGNDAVGNTYFMTGVLWSGATAGAIIIHRDRHTGPSEPLIRIQMDTCPDNGPQCQPRTKFTGTVPSIDIVHGSLTIVAEGQTRNEGPAPWARESAIVTITGLPQLYDEVLSFIPGGSALSLTTPALPDAFRSADSVQVWTGNVRSMPNWAEAEPLACDAAINPIPGEVLIVADTLPDPPVNEGRYYVVANVSGRERRLGRRYVAGSFSARDPSLLPICQ